MHRPTWRQVNVAFPDWERAETAALTHLAPLLRRAEGDGALTAWFLMRKRPCWRVRYLPTADGHDCISRDLDLLAARGHIEAWSEVVYEPEAHAFGGTPSMATAHRLFHRDSRCIVDLLPGEAAQHRREMSLLLCSLLMRSAGQDWYERGDIWARVAEHRPRPSEHDTDAGSCDRLHAAVHRLITVDGTNLMQRGGSLAHAAGWADAYRDAGRELAHLNDTGQLHRGLRDVLAHHVIFAWNRIGLPYETQAALAVAAKAVIFGPDPIADGSTVNTDSAEPRGHS